MIIGGVVFLKTMRTVLQIQDYYLILFGLKSMYILSEQEKNPQFRVQKDRAS